MRSVLVFRWDFIFNFSLIFCDSRVSAETILLTPLLFKLHRIVSILEKYLKERYFSTRHIIIGVKKYYCKKKKRVIAAYMKKRDTYRNTMWEKKIIIILHSHLDDNIYTYTHIHTYTYIYKILMYMYIYILRCRCF